MAAASMAELQAADTNLTRSFLGAIAAAVASTAWTLVSGAALQTEAPDVQIALAAVGLLLLQVACYVWYAMSAGRAARLLGATAWHYVTWILAAPFVAMLPIPIVSTLIAISPLSVKLLLGGQLQTAIRQATFEELHRA
jgi:hypothetical protein